MMLNGVKNMHGYGHFAGRVSSPIFLSLIRVQSIQTELSEKAFQTGNTKYMGCDEGT